MMSKSLNKISLIGHVGSKSETKVTASTMKIVNISLATSEKKKDGSDEVQWHRLVAFGQTAEIIEKYVTKGMRIYIEGKLVYNKFTNKEGIEVKTSDIIINNLIMLSKNEETGASYEPQKRMPLDEYDDIPF